MKWDFKRKAGAWKERSAFQFSMPRLHRFTIHGSGASCRNPDALRIEELLARYAPRNKISVANPRKIKKPPVSVTAVSNTLAPAAGSRPRR